MKGSNFVSLGSAAVVVALMAGARSDDPPNAAQSDGKVRTITTSGISFDVPESWSQKAPTSQMRKAQVNVSPAEGDKAPAELVLFVFPGGAGTVEANVERWRNQFTDESGNPSKVETSTVRGRGDVKVTRVEAAGTYKDPFAAGGPEANFRLYGAIVTTDDAGYFFKMVGPEKTMRGAKEGFDKMLTTITLK